MEQSQFLTSVFDALSHPFYVIDADDYTVKMANTAAYPGQLPGGITCHLLFHETRTPCNEHGQVCPLLEIRKTRRPAVVEHIRRDIDGESSVYEVHAHPIYDSQGTMTHIIEYTLEISERKQLEKTLRESEANWRSLTEASPDHILTLDTSFNILYANFASPGLTVGDLIGKPIYTFVDEDRQAEIKAIMEGVLETGVPARYETAYHTPDSGDIYYESRVTALKMPDSNQINGLTLSARDITERKKSEQEVQNLARFPSENRNPVLRIAKDGKILHANDASAPLLAIWGVNLDQNLPDKWFRLVASVMDSDEDRVAEIICDDRVFSLEFVPITEAGYVNVYGRDITERKQMDRELRQRRHQLRERVKELNCLYGISGLVITPGITLEEILQGSVDLIPPSWQYPEIACARIIIGDQEYRTENFRQGLWKQSADILIHGEISGLIEVYYLEERPPISSVSESPGIFQEGPFLKEERNLINAIAERLGRIIERSRAEEQVHQNEMLLATLEERERIGRELHDDLGQVMSYVSAQAQAALVRLGEGNVEEANAILDQLAKIALDASDDVRAYILGIRTASTHPKAAFFATLARYREMLHKRYGLQTQVSLPDEWREGPFAPEVETQVLRIIQEALTNVRRHAGVDSARLIFTEYADEVQVIIEDDGRGFDPNSVEASTADPNSLDGSDGHFGLAIMRERAAASSGRLEVRSRPGEGTQVIICLPRAISQSVKPSRETARGIRVLLVDDHPLYLEGLSNLLAARGMQVVGQAHDGLAAQRLARELRPDLILMDLNMPHCDGLEATRSIKAELPEVMIVILTVAADEKILFEALKSGASGYLLKSLDRTQFFALLGQVLEGETVLSPDLAARVLSEMVGSQTRQITQAAEETHMTARQVEVLEQIVTGKTNKEIATNLHISERTVKYHVGQILERLQMKSRYELSHYARQQGSHFQTED